MSWLPFFHDMGLVTALLPAMIGHYFTFMTPAAFVRRPGRWIRELAYREGDTGGAISVAPNFAFDHAAARGVPKDDEEPLDLSHVKAILNGSEPISAATVQRFNDASVHSVSSPRPSSRLTAWPRQPCSSRPPPRLLKNRRSSRSIATS